jgi:hypothetical protein
MVQGLLSLQLTGGYWHVPPLHPASRVQMSPSGGQMMRSPQHSNAVVPQPSALNFPQRSSIVHGLQSSHSALEQ